MAEELGFIKLSVSKEWISKMINSGAKKVHPEKLRAFADRQKAVVKSRGPQESVALGSLLEGVATKNKGMLDRADRVLEPLGKRRHAEQVAGEVWRKGARKRLADAGQSIGNDRAHLLG